MERTGVVVFESLVGLPFHSTYSSRLASRFQGGKHTPVSLKGHHDEDLDVICHLYHSEFDKEHIRVQLLLLGVDFDVVTAD